MDFGRTKMYLCGDGGGVGVSVTTNIIILIGRRFIWINRIYFWCEIVHQNGEKFLKFPAFCLSDENSFEPAPRCIRRKIFALECSAVVVVAAFFFCSVSFSSFIFCFAYFAPSKPLRSYRPHAPLPFVDELVDEFILFAPKVFAPLAFVVSFGAYFAVGSFYFPLLFLLLVVDVVQVCVAGPLSSLPIRVRACTRDFELGDDGIWSRNTSLFFHRLALLLWRNSCLVSPVPAQHESEKT